MKAARTSLIAAAALVLSAGALIARTHEAPPPTSTRPDLHSASVHRHNLSLDQAVRMAQRRFKARVVRAETQTQGDRTIYVLRMLDDAGRVFAVRVDAVSGTII